MPELPDVKVYVDCINERFQGQPLEAIRLKSTFLLRTVEPPLASLHGRVLQKVERLGKRLVFNFDEELHLVLHLMIAGRLREKKAGAAIPGRMGLAAFDFPGATLMLTEASTKKRASLHLVHGKESLAEHDRGGLEVLEHDFKAFKTHFTAKNHTLKRALTDPRILSGIGNAYSDEILFRAQISPFKQTQKIDDSELKRIHTAIIEVLSEWTELLKTQLKGAFPDKVTAFHEEMAVHGKYKEACKVCGTKIQRVVYAENEMNYCPTCQNQGRLLADRSLSRLMKKDWPKTVEELERG